MPVEISEKWPVLGRHELASGWLRIWTDLGRAPRTIDACAATAGRPARHARVKTPGDGARGARPRSGEFESIIPNGRVFHSRRSFLSGQPALHPPGLEPLI